MIMVQYKQLMPKWYQAGPTSVGTYHTKTAAALGTVGLNLYIVQSNSNQHNHYQTYVQAVTYYKELHLLTAVSV
jgi:hypothetical protein